MPHSAPWAARDSAAGAAWEGHADLAELRHTEAALDTLSDGCGGMRVAELHTVIAGLLDGIEYGRVAEACEGGHTFDSLHRDVAAQLRQEWRGHLLHDSVSL